MNESSKAPTNPYQTSQTIGVSTSAPADTGTKGVWRDSDQLIVRNGMTRFPAACIVCGNTECRPLKCTVRIRPSLAYLAFPVLAAFSTSVSISPGLCAEHRGREQRFRWIGHIIALMGVTLLIAPFVVIPLLSDATEEVALILVLLAMLVGGLSWPAWIYYRVFRPRIVWAEKIDGKNATIANVHERVLNAVPPLPSNMGN